MSQKQALIRVFKVAMGILLCYAAFLTLLNGRRLLQQYATKEGITTVETDKLNTADDNSPMTMNKVALSMVEKMSGFLERTLGVTTASKNKAECEAIVKRAAAMDKLALSMMNKMRGSVNITIKAQEDKKAVYEKKKLEAEEYIKKHANPPAKKDIPPTIETFVPSSIRRNTRMLIRDLKEVLQTDKIKQELSAEKKRRMDLGDDDLLQIPEVKEEIEKNPTTVPNIVHFIWFSCNSFKVHHFTSMMGALVYQKPKIMLLHTNCVPKGDYWDAFVEQAGPTLKIVKRSPPLTVWGKNMKVIEHQADVARLHIMLETGGIYLDGDTAVVKSLDEFREHEIVLGEAMVDALSNGIILANRNSWFLQRWFQEYRDFNDAQWAESSVLLPWWLWRMFPMAVHVVKRKFIRPNFFESSYIYQQLYDWSENYLIHFYARLMQKLDGTSERSLRDLAILNSTYGEVTRHILWGDKRPRDITFLM